MQKSSYNSISEAIKQLRSKGFTQDFRPRKAGVLCVQSGEILTPDSLQILEHHLFESVSNSNALSVIYAVVDARMRKGILMDFYEDVSELTRLI